MAEEVLANVCLPTSAVQNAVLRVDPQTLITIVTDTGCCLFFANFLSLLSVDPVLLGW